MAELVANCPRCGARNMTFDVLSEIKIREEYGWLWWFETFSVCRHCHVATNFVLKQKLNTDYDYVHKAGLLEVEGSLNDYVEVHGHISIKDKASVLPPEHVPQPMADVFREGATCLTVGCYNAAGTMFRLCLDLATRSMLPVEETAGLNGKTRRDLGLRIPWLLETGRLPQALKDLSSCIKDDGNDGAHQGTLGEADAQDLLDFTVALLERVYTEPERLRLAKERTKARRAKS